ncbi:PREDICTED: protochlorophyllide-dependent translocon component 52, chloroplastic-like [Fragaria vesca subsp. vesca]|uniref:protochlorophyllide-dependent translocon component 52, chloroplastic-like n=1 Tax=Fragaria vesca subsp. vesca TaxID=101020 RepID=UPI0002C31444|nr:PREDICTED: protochlorophyllide-dependent translocon component 52, chloroplastic-like [Fragaria vesca subsp. vesca]XP_011469382.1 PREDICTED: protochlorophyllide-dependent translocon component 52, chloroplastic-like [Fragaria vesca subsp. vesca]
MATLRISSIHPTLQAPANFDKTQSQKFTSLEYKQTLTSSFSLVQRHKPSFKTFTTISSSSITTETANNSSAVPQVETQTQGEKFDWYAHWYPLMPVCDLDKRVPHAKKVLGIDVVVWWDRNGSAWKVFDDACPHRLAPLSEGRIDQWGRLQCVYHGWCFNGSGDCKFIPQAPTDGPPVHTSKKACVGSYPSTVQNGIVWFWPSSDPQYKDILAEKKPPYIPEMDDPSYTCLMASRELPYGYEVLIENLMDPAHAPYAHYGIMPTQEPEEKADREGGRPMDLHISKLDINGFTVDDQNSGQSKYVPPCLFYSSLIGPIDNSNGAALSGKLYGFVKPPGNGKVSATSRALLVFFCVPVSPGYSRLITTHPINFGLWVKIRPRWLSHTRLNLILDSDLYLLHLEERRMMDAGTQWQKACFVPTKSDVVVVAYRKWINQYAGGQVDWRGKYTGELPPTPPKEQLMDRYQSHVVNCSSCNAAHKNLGLLKVVLQVVSFSLLGIVAASKQGVLSSVVAKGTLLATALLCYAGSKWLANFIYKIFHFHDYNHALV